MNIRPPGFKIRVISRSAGTSSRTPDVRLALDANDAPQRLALPRAGTMCEKPGFSTNTSLLELLPRGIEKCVGRDKVLAVLRPSPA